MINPIANALATNHTATAHASSSNGSSGASSDPLASTSSDLFLKLLVAQLRTQDPTSPMDPTQMVGQMLAFDKVGASLVYQLVRNC